MLEPNLQSDAWWEWEAELRELIRWLFVFIKSHCYSIVGNKFYAGEQIEASPIKTLRSVLITSVLVKDEMVWHLQLYAGYNSDTVHTGCPMGCFAWLQSQRWVSTITENSSLCCTFFFSLFDLILCEYASHFSSWMLTLSKVYCVSYFTGKQSMKHSVVCVCVFLLSYSTCKQVPLKNDMYFVPPTPALWWLGWGEFHTQTSHVLL